MKRFSFIMVLFLGWSAMAQTTPEVLSMRQYLKWVLENHPVAKQSELLQDLAEAEQMKARGGFDPKLDANFSQKQFDNKEYYQIGQAELKIPTWLGITVNASYANNDGLFLNPQNFNDTHGIWNVGIEANLLRGLVMDERRAALRQAEVFSKMTENEQNIMLNELTLSAAKVYIYWWILHKNEAFIKQSVETARSYLQATRESFILGDKPAIDTLEAHLLLQDRMTRLQGNSIQIAEAKQLMENYLWLDESPLLLNEKVQPEDLDKDLNLPDSWNLDMLIEQHPKVIGTNLEQESLAISERLNREMLKPELSVKFQPLAQTPSNAFDTQWTMQNYQWGAGFSFPLFIRKERGELEKTKIKITQNNWKLADYRNEIRNKLEAFQQKADLLKSQLEILDENVENYRRLLEAERIKFDIGESSVFLLNSREMKYLEALIKREETRGKLHANYYEWLKEANEILEVARD